MNVTHNFASSNLLCTEDNTSIMVFDDGELEGFDEGAKGYDPGWIPEKRSDFYGDFLKGFPVQSEEFIASLVEKELEHIPGEDYAKRLLSRDLDISVRGDAIDWIGKVHAHHSFGPLSAYLSVNYVDRFLSACELPEGKAWMAQLLSVACLSLAAKMDENEVPLSLDLQVGEAQYSFEARTIQRMELLVLSTLKWRMQAVTPFSFIDYFLQKFNDGKSPTKSLVLHSVELILNTVRGTGFLGFRPSEIAAAVALLALKEIQIVEIENNLTRCIHVDKERVLRCYEEIKAMTLVGKESSKSASPSVSPIPHSPIGVLNVAFLSSKSDDITVGSHAKSQIRSSCQG
ncbi:cyclin-D4-1 isoform X2 [Elaeis guineensis]|uniref:Cyclin-D4-1-like isoform X2 n=1 Tax=Elaeis guineensis var. tenera TaxID=51953 RepID=A0A8N4ICZ3_ELAGV|nr:cyclin-D4-1-like isoform X2 [Elaeis guineensis]